MLESVLISLGSQLVGNVVGGAKKEESQPDPLVVGSIVIGAIGLIVAIVSLVKK